MIQPTKNKEAILLKLGIKELNPMQKEAHEAIQLNNEIVLISPTGTGKTLAFLLPIIEELDSSLIGIQVLILVPSRELAIQIEQIAREMGSGFKINAVYGGRSGAKDKIDLKHPPTILIGTPGRIADHLRRENISVDHLKTLVLDEFDKSLEVGFEVEMKEILATLPSTAKKILTSATQKIAIPPFVGLTNPSQLTFSSEETSQLRLITIVSESEDKLETLIGLLEQMGDANGIVFCNFKDSIKIVSAYLEKSSIDHACFYGGIEQIERERALLKFRNGTHRLLIATDLAARGIDVPAMDFIVHYELPYKKEEFTHRNGRTARMHQNGTSYILKWKDQSLPSYITGAVVERIKERENVSPSKKWTTLFISGGRKDKISKGDIAGLFFKQGKLKKDDLGLIELKQDCAFVSIPSAKANELIGQLNNSRLKKKKVRISVLD